MDLKKYFESIDGFGALSTANAKGVVNSALFARPHILSSDTLAFITIERLNYLNLKENPSAYYLFKDSSDEYSGVRLVLTKISEEKNSPKIAELSRRELKGDRDRYLITFKIEKVLPLVGDGSSNY